MLGTRQLHDRRQRQPRAEPQDQESRTFGAQFAEVEVDTETGRVNVLRIYAAHEAGRVINSLAFGSQIEGGVIQGVGSE
ncbi:MAG: molybdopterin cofactor-binding domain-containing protein [Chloroflexia bacterium]